MIYLDSAATTLQKPSSVGRAMVQALASAASPGRGEHGPAARAAQVLWACRQEAAALFGVPDPEQVVLTFNATHGLNLAVHAMVKPGSTVLLSGYEHNAVTRPLSGIPGVRIKTVSAPLFQPEVFLENFTRQLGPEVDGVICTHVSNVFGYMLPVAEVAALCRERGVPLLVDAAQSAGLLPISLSAWDAAFVAMPGHKALYGPQGTGLLLCRSAEETLPLLSGGTGSLSRQQEMPDFLPDRLEAGTHNVPGTAGLLEGLRFVRKQTPALLLRHEIALQAHLTEGLRRFPGAEVFSGAAGTQSGVISFRFAGKDPGEVSQRLAERGFALRAGLHCAPMAHETAHTLPEGTLRASFSAFNTHRDIERLLSALGKLV